MRPRFTAPLLLTVSMLVASCDATPSTAPDGTTCATSLALRVGEVRRVAGAAALGCVEIAPNSETATYTVAIVNGTPVVDDLLRVTLRATGPSVVASGAVASSAVAPSSAWHTSADADAVAAAADAEAHAALERAIRRRASRFQPARPAAPRQVAPRDGTPVEASMRPAPVTVGDARSFRVGRADAADLCTSFAAVSARVRAVGTHVIIAEDSAAPSGGFSDADYAALAAEFDGLVYPTIVDWFGAPSDIDANGRVTLLFTPQINRLTPPGSLGFAGGFFFAGDLQPRSGAPASACASSNEQEILYLLVPDPVGVVNGNRFSLERASESARGTIAHELQHLVNLAGRRARQPGATQETVWLDEGLSHFAEEVMGRAERGYRDDQRLRFADLQSDLDAFDAFFRQNTLRARLWLEAPAEVSPTSDRAAGDLGARGASWLFVRYLVDRFGGATPRAFTRALVRGPELGLPNVIARAQGPFEPIAEGFAAAALAEVSVTDAASALRSLDLADVMREVNGGPYPLQPAPLPTSRSVTIRAGSAAYFSLSASGPAPTVVRLLDATGNPLAADGARLLVIRTR